MKGKKILLGICGSIAAYKSASLIRLLVKSGADVKVVMTSDAREFITPLTLSSLSKNPVASSFVKNDQGEWQNHVELALWADVFLIAPATANTLAKAANGNCDNLLMATYLSAKCPIIWAPAMDLDMYQHPATLKNLSSLNAYGNIVLGASHGELASGLIGEGRMQEPEELHDFLEAFFNKKKSKLQGLKAVLTAGPTYEKIDPVRFIGNHSSGKMGIALAQELYSRGVLVTLILGPSSQPIPKGINTIHVQSAEDMFKEANLAFTDADLGVMTAAVADYKPKQMADRKIKKENTEDISLELEKTVDILATLGKSKKSNQLLVGFALETDNEKQNAKGKLKRKNCDLLVLNSLNDKGAGFAGDTNKVTLFFKNGTEKPFELKSKTKVAADIIDAIESLL
ncbi:MAG: phosphopantothenoylcysteine decarboxylase/phosphopantothenate--cysteine ligase [Sphingobacteriales bacterium]|jgi:phosphopantothenoylcysteine decarboxylase/phosphopantothenate--cysteine ligase